MGRRRNSLKTRRARAACSAPSKKHGFIPSQISWSPAWRKRWQKQRMLLLFHTWHWWQVLGLLTLLFMLTCSGPRCSCLLSSEFWTSNFLAHVLSCKLIPLSMQMPFSRSKGSVNPCQKPCQISTQLRSPASDWSGASWPAPFWWAFAMTGEVEL